MTENGKEYIVGTVRPTNRPESGQEIELDDAIPAKIKFLTLTMGFTQGDQQEFLSSMPGYEAKVAELAAAGADLIRPSGAPPFMLLGFRGEHEIISAWENRYGVQMFTSGQNHVRAMRALGVKRFVGASYFPDDMNAIFTRYFTEAGFEPLAMEGIKVAFAEVPRLPAAEISGHVRRLAAKHPDAEAIYMLGSAWKTLDIIDPLEQRLRLPVIHPSPARCWETQLRLGLHHPIRGYGRLLAEMPS